MKINDIVLNIFINLVGFFFEDIKRPIWRHENCCENIFIFFSITVHCYRCKYWMLYKLKSALHETLILIGYEQYALYFYLHRSKVKINAFRRETLLLQNHCILTMQTFHESKNKFCNRVALSTTALFPKLI